VTATSTLNTSISGTAKVTVTDTTVVPPGNLALGRSVVVSSQDPVLPAANAVDGNGATRWGSAEGVDPSWIYVDLGAIYSVNHVVLQWETAYARAYQIQVSNDASTWTTVFSTTTGNGATDDITFASTTARYVRMYGTQRGTRWGYSLWEFGVYGLTSSDPPVLTSLSASPTSATVAVGSTQTFSASGLDQYGAPIAASVDWMVSGGGTIDTDGVFTASTAGGPFTVTATSQSDGSITATASVTVTDTAVVPPGNLALGQPVTVSSTEAPQVGGDSAVDGSTATRWSSQYADPQWIYVDLGASYPINRVVLQWEAAYARAYQIQVSNDASTWTTVFSETSSNGGTDDITFGTVTARYVRMYGTQRATSWGYSLWEFGVYGGN
jgi:hypothetical protein